MVVMTARGRVTPAAAEPIRTGASPGLMKA